MSISCANPLVDMDTREYILSTLVKEIYKTEQRLHDHFLGCFLTELWNLPAPGVTFLSDVSFLNYSFTQYPSCDDGSVGSVVLVNTTLKTATVAYYSGTTSGSTACFVCDESSEYALNTSTTTERVCRSNGTWSGSAIVCGML